MDRKRLALCLVLIAASLSGCASKPSVKVDRFAATGVEAGEATRVSGEERKGVASAYGQRGAFANCEYQMNTPSQGAGTCTFSNGAKYQVHIGS